MSKLSMLFYFLVIPLIGNAQTPQNHQHSSNTMNANPTLWDNPNRAPLRSEIAKLMGELKGKIVADIGAGAGFFGFEYAKTSKKVIATEIDPNMINYMKDKKRKYGQKNVEIKKGQPDFSEFEGEHIDYAIMVNVLHHLEDPEGLLSKLISNMNTGGKIIISETSYLDSDTIIKYLKGAGFINISKQIFSYSSRQMATRIFTGLVGD